MKQTADYLRATVANLMPLFEALNDENTSQKPFPNKWSKKEILGHLIDSAANNQQKFVRMMQQSHLDFVGYEQNHWVDAQQYNKTNWVELLTFWQHFNLHIAHIIENVATSCLQNTININGEGPFALAFIMKDYVEHLKHHARQILPDADIESAFVNVYNNEV